MMKPWCKLSAAAVAAGVIASAGVPASAKAACSALEVRFNPQGVPGMGGREPLSPQIAVWLEDTAGNFVADVFVTQLVGFMGLGNRPGQALLKSDYRWPYGRRPMALPIWAYRRGKTYKLVAMGGKCSPTCPPDFEGSPSDDDTTVAYHGPVSSTEPFYCSPSGFRTVKMGGVDVVSCASAFYGSKGWYVPGQISHYPPRADLKAFGANDHADVMKFSTDNDVAAISGATPEVGKVIDPPILWPRPMTLPNGDYRLRVEVNREGDFNASWPAGKSVHEPHSEWDYLGKEFIGQPSVVYSVLFRLDATPRTATATDYIGYGDWKGDSGIINASDATISTTGGSGADRLHPVTDADGTWRVKVKTVGCGAACTKPATPSLLSVSDVTTSALKVSFVGPAGDLASMYQLRFRAGKTITDADFDSATPAASPVSAPAGVLVTTQVVGLMADTLYYLALRPIDDCGKAGPVITVSAQTAPMGMAGPPDMDVSMTPYDMPGSDAKPGSDAYLGPGPYLGWGCYLTARNPQPGVPSALLAFLLALPLTLSRIRRRRTRT